MARLQILELPEGSGDDRPPFVLVVDQCAPQRIVLGVDAPWRDYWEDIADKIGARGVIVTPDTIDSPANDTTAYLQQAAEETGATIGNAIRAANAQQLADERTDIARDMDRLAKWKNELANALGIDPTSNWDDIRNTAAEFRAELVRSENARERLRQDRDEARSWARHGYEIGQKHCGWTDHGVAPDWLTDGWPPHIDACQHLKAAAELDEALTRVRNLPADPEVMNAQQEHPSAWKHGYHCGVLAAKAALRPRNEPTTKPTDA
jgi:hypothetical protein